MDAEQFNRVKELFYAVLERKPEERSVFLDEACRDDQALRTEVEKLLAEALDDADALDSPLMLHLEGKTSGEPLIHGRIGPYQLKHVISTGGMGTVYAAVQEHPHRTVAVKVMRTGIASRSTLRRFEYEAQILANLRHPSIAQIIEAGTHREEGEEEERGVPYFVMEYIPNARSLTEYAREKKLTIRERLELFMQVCDAVHHGHQKGIIHRDLKPANLLVDAQGQVKIIDFGVARATDSDVALTTQHTDVGQLIGTVQYMSPEQCLADPHDLDIRSDVYSLGVVLYELLCDELPYDVSNVAIFEATRKIREEAPKKPSTTNRTLRGDVETIVLKALEKDRERRYASAEAIRRDIDRYFKGEPITARPPSVAYQIRSFARRHKALVWGTAVVFVVLVAGVIVSSTMYFRSEAARLEVLQESERAGKINDFFSEMLATVDTVRLPWMSNYVSDSGNVPATSIKTTAPESLAETIRRKIPEIDKIFAGKPELEARARETIGITLAGLGRLKEADTQLKRSIDLYVDLFGEDDPRTIHSKLQMCMIMKLRCPDRLCWEAESLVRNELDRVRHLYEDGHPNILSCECLLAYTLHTTAKRDESNPQLPRLLAELERAPSVDIRITLMTMAAWITSLRVQHRFIEMDQYLEEALDLCYRTVGPRDYFTIYLECWKSYLLAYRGKYAEAERVAREAFDKSRFVFGEQHFQTYISECFYALSLFKVGKEAEVIQRCQEALDGLRETLGERCGYTFYTWKYYIDFLLDHGLKAEAENQIRQWMEAELIILRDGDFWSASPIWWIICSLRDLGNDLLSHEFAEKVIQLKDSFLDAPSIQHISWFLLYHAPAEQRDIDEAIEYAELAIQSYESDDYDLYDAINQLAMANLMQKDYERALENLQRAIAAVPEIEGQSRRRFLDRQLSSLLFQMGKPDKAGKVLADSIDRCRKTHDERSPYFGEILAKYILMLLREGQFGLAEPLAKECLMIFVNTDMEAKQEIAYAQILWSACMAGLDRCEEAKRLLGEAYPEFKDNPVFRLERQFDLQGLVNLYDSLDLSGLVEEWREMLQGKQSDSVENH